MDVTNSVEPTVVDGGQAIAFEVIAAGRVVKCTVSRESLQDYFWLQPDADDARVLKTFNDGCRRIVAIAEGQGASIGDRIYSPRDVGLSAVGERVTRGNAIHNANMKAENSNPREAAALARVAEAAREVQAASVAIEAHFTAVGERQASALELARLTAAVQELEDARLALAVVIDDGNG